MKGGAKPVSEKKHSRQWHGNEGYRVGNSGRRHEHRHGGILDNLFGVSRESAGKRDSYDKGWKKGRAERNRNK